jgi:hypothetical protein
MNSTVGLETLGTIDFVKKLTDEVGKLEISIRAELLRKIQTLESNWITTKSSQDGRDNTSGWLYTDSAWSIGLKSKGKGKKATIRHIGYQISLTGDGIPQHISEPVIHILCWDDFVSFNEGFYSGFPVDPDENAIVEDGCLIVFSPNDEKRTWDQSQWTFTLRLLAINSDSDVQNYIVNPTISLMQGNDASTALEMAIAADAVVRYTTEQIRDESKHGIL